MLVPQIKTVSLELIEPDAEQPRQTFDDETIDQLGQSLKEIGQQQPLIVYEWEDRFKIMDGHQRYLSAKRHEIPELMVLILEERPDADTLLLWQLTANCQRSDLKPLERAKAFERLKELRGLTNAELAKTLHISKSRVTESLSYLTLPVDLQQKIDSGELAGSTGYLIARTKEPEKQERLVADARQGRLTRERASTRRQPQQKGRKVVCRLTGAVVTVKTTAPLTTGTLKEALQAALKEARRAEADGFDVATLEMMLTDRARKNSQEAA